MDPLLVNKLIGIQQQLRILHWQTKSYARHKAFGDTYDSFADLIDEFMEVFMGKYGRFTLEQNYVQIINLDELDVDDFIISSVSMLKDLNGTLNPETDSDLLNIRDEMMAKLNKLKYLLTLK